MLKSDNLLIFCLMDKLPFDCYVQRSLATDLQNLSMEFRKKQSTYLKQLRQQKEVPFFCGQIH